MQDNGVPMLKNKQNINKIYWYTIKMSVFETDAHTSIIEKSKNDRQTLKVSHINKKKFTF